MPLPAAVIPAALGVAQAVTGLIKGGKAKREAARLKASRPQLEESPFIDDQLSLAQSELSTGLSADTERAYEEGLSRDLSSSLNAILQGGGDVNNVAEIFDRSATGRQRLSMMKENLRLNQINNLAAAQAAAENERLQRFEFNQFRPWADEAQAVAGARQGAENMLWGGLQTVAGAATGFLQGQNTQNELNKYFNSEQVGRVSPTIRSSMPSTTPVNYGRASSPAASYPTINPNYANNMFNNNVIDDSLFYPSEIY